MVEAMVLGEGRPPPHRLKMPGGLPPPKTAPLQWQQPNDVTRYSLFMDLPFVRSSFRKSSLRMAFLPFELVTKNVKALLDATHGVPERWSVIEVNFEEIR